MGRETVPILPLPFCPCSLQDSMHYLTRPIFGRMPTTWMSLLLGLFLGVYAQFLHGFPGFFSSASYHIVTTYGWPMLCVVRTESGSLARSPAPPPRINFDIYPGGLAMNVLLFLSMAFCTAAIVERLTRACNSRLQFKLATMLWILTVASATMALVNLEPGFYRAIVRSVGITSYFGDVMLPWYLRLPVYFGVACILYVSGSYAWQLSKGRIGRRRTSEASRLPHQS